MDNESVVGLEPTWAVIELFGHSQIAGKLSTMTLGGAVLLKVEVPETLSESVEHGYFENRRYGAKFKVETRTPAYTRLLGVGAIYAINPCTEEMAVKMATRIAPSETARAQQIETRTALPPPEPIEARALAAGEQSTDGIPFNLDPDPNEMVCSHCGSSDVELVEDSEEGNSIECNQCKESRSVVRKSETVSEAQPEPSPEAPEREQA